MYETSFGLKVAMDAVERNRYELIPHPAYSPDLAPSDFLFPNLKKGIRGCHYWTDEEVVTTVEVWVNGKDPDFFSSGDQNKKDPIKTCPILDIPINLEARLLKPHFLLSWKKTKSYFTGAKC